MNKPSLGRIVHYVVAAEDHLLTNTKPETTCAAIITAVDAEGRADLTVFPPAGPAFNVDQVTVGDQPERGKAHWPSRV